MKKSDEQANWSSLNISKAKKTDGLVIIDLELLHLSLAIPWGGETPGKYSFVQGLTGINFTLEVGEIRLVYHTTGKTRTFV